MADQFPQCPCRGLLLGTCSPDQHAAGRKVLLDLRLEQRSNPRCSLGPLTSLFVRADCSARGVVVALGRIQKCSLFACGLLALLPALPVGATPLCDSLTAGRYDIIYVCPAAWRTQVARLAIRRSQPAGGGYSSIIAPVETLTTCFAPGRAGIRAMLHQALAGWSGPPKHVVLVGAYRSSDTTTYIIPTWFINDPPVGFWTSYVPTDDPYVFVPNSTDSLPGASIGRIPVWNLSDLTSYINKVIAYENAGLPSWKTTALHVTEDRDYDGNNGFLARDHSDSLFNYFSPREQFNFTTSRVYGTQINNVWTNQAIIPPWNGGLGYAFFYGTTGSNSLFAFFSHNQGPSCQSPIIFGCPSNPCTYGDSLAPNNKTPLVFAMTCGNGYSGMSPGQPTTCGTFAQYLLATPGKGAVVVVGPTRALHETPGYAVSRKWCLAMFQTGQPSTYSEPGTAMKQAKQQLMPTMPAYHTEIMQMAVLGDPALQFFVGSDVVIGVGGTEENPPVRVFMARPVSVPAPDLTFSVDFPRGGTYELRLFDVQGRQVAEHRCSIAAPERGRLIHFDLPEAEAGVYFLLGYGESLVLSAKTVLLR